MADGRYDCGGECTFVQVATCSGSPDATAAPDRGVRGNRRGFFGRAARKQASYLFGHSGDQCPILLTTLRGSARPGVSACIRVERARLFGTLQRRHLHQDALSFVASARTAEPHDHGTARAVLRGASREGGVARAQILQISKPRARQT